MDHLITVKVYLKCSRNSPLAQYLREQEKEKNTNLDAVLLDGKVKIGHLIPKTNHAQQILSPHDHPYQSRELHTREEGSEQINNGWNWIVAPFNLPAQFGKGSCEELGHLDKVPLHTSACAVENLNGML
jgi:hypothetical protein